MAENQKRLLMLIASSLCVPVVYVGGADRARVERSMAELAAEAAALFATRLQSPL